MYASLVDVLYPHQVKRAMLDSANDTIEQLKAELADMQVMPSRWRKP